MPFFGGKKKEPGSDDGGSSSGFGSSAYALSRAGVNNGAGMLFRPKQYGVGECFHSKTNMDEAVALVAPPNELVIGNGRFLVLPRVGPGGRKQLLLFVSHRNECKRVLIDRVDPADEQSNLTVDGKASPVSAIGDLLMYLQNDQAEIAWVTRLKTPIPPGAKVSSSNVEAVQAKNRRKSYSNDDELPSRRLSAQPLVELIDHEPRREQTPAYLKNMNPTRLAPVEVAQDFEHVVTDMSNFGRQNPQPKKEVGDAVKDKRASVHDAWDSGEHKNATWVPENEFGRNVPKPLQEHGTILRNKQHAIKTGLGEGDLNNATWVPANQFGRVVADPHAEVGEHIKGKANRNSMGIENGELNNATWVPANQYGRVVADPHAEVGEHIDGKRVSVTADLLTGEIHNASWVAPNMHGRVIADPESEVGEYIKDKPAKVHEGLNSGEANNAEGTQRGEHGYNIHDPEAEVGEHIKDMTKRTSTELVDGKLDNATWVPENQFGRINIEPEVDIEAQRKLFEEQLRLEEEFKQKMAARRAGEQRRAAEEEKQARLLKEQDEAKQNRLTDAKVMAKRNEEEGKRFKEVLATRPKESTPILWSYKGGGASDDSDDDSEDVDGFGSDEDD